MNIMKKNIHLCPSRTVMWPIVVLLKANLKSFLHRLQTLFEYDGGVSNKIWFDNFSADVLKIEKKQNMPQRI